MHLSVEDFGDPAVERGGLTTDMIQKDAERRLRKAGIRILTEDEWLRTPGGPTP